MSVRPEKEMECGRDVYEVAAAKMDSQRHRPISAYRWCNLLPFSGQGRAESLGELGWVVGWGRGGSQCGG